MTRPARPPGRRAGTDGGGAIDLDRARARADRAVARAARPRAAASGASRSAPKTTTGSRTGSRSSSTTGTSKTTTRPKPTGSGATRRPAATRTGTPVRVVSSTPKRSATNLPPPPRPRTRARRAPDPGPEGLLARGQQAAGSVAHFFGHTPTSRQRTLPDKVTRVRSTRRLLATAATLILIFGVVVVRLVDLQVLNAEAYTRTDQRTHRDTLPADRGAITDRRGDVLALSAPAASVFVDGKFMAGAGSDPHADADVLASVLEPDPVKARERAADIETKMRDAERQFTPVAHQLPAEVVDRIKAIKEEKDPTDVTGRRKKLTGVAFYDEPKRFRPAGDVARSLIGDTDIDGLGISGIERRYGDDLTGTPGSVIIERSPAGRTIAPAEPQIVPAVKGRDIQLTIDRALQYDTEQILADQLRTVGGASAVAIVAKPDTGEILAMANVNAERAGDEVTDVHVSSKNDAVIDAYEPGSVMKLVTAAGALEEGVVKPDTSLPVGPTIKVCNATFKEAEANHSIMGSASVSEIIAKSSNVGTIKVAQQLGRDRLYTYLRAFGFGEPTAMDFPNEQGGNVPRPDRQDEWWCSSDGSVPIGQSVSVTPLQMLAAYNTIANGGVYVPPRLLAATVDADGTRHVPPPAAVRRVVSPETANQLNLILRSVVADGTGTAAAIAGYTPAGKTGTARQAHGGGYQAEDGKTHYDATFAGFVPAEAPALSILVLIRDPLKPGTIYGGTAAAPAFSRIGAAALRRYDVPPPASDLAKGGAAVDPSNPTRTPSVPAGGTPAPGTGLEHTDDGRVRVKPAGVTTTTAAPPRPTTTRATVATRTASTARAGPTTTRAGR